MGIFATAGIAALMIMLSQSDTLEPADSSPSIAKTIDALPPSGAGFAAMPAPAQAPRAYLGGSKATGRVAQVYVKVGENVFLALNEAPKHLQDSAERWVDVEFPELLANDVGAARALLSESEAGVQVGDVVEIKFAHKKNPRFFPVKELTRVTHFVAKRNEMLAKEYERRILARTHPTDTDPAWLRHARAALPAEADGAGILTAAAR